MISSPRPWRPLSQSSSGGCVSSACREIRFTGPHGSAVNSSQFCKANRQRSPDGRSADSEMSPAPLHHEEQREICLIKPACPSACPTMDGGPMAQQMVSWFVCDGRFRVHAINAVGRRKGRIVGVEEVETGEGFYGSARRLERLVQTLHRSGGELDRVSPWTPATTS